MQSTKERRKEPRTNADLPLDIYDPKGRAVVGEETFYQLIDHRRTHGQPQTVEDPHRHPPAHYSRRKTGPGTHRESGLGEKKDGRIRIRHPLQRQHPASSISTPSRHGIMDSMPTTSLPQTSIKHIPTAVEEAELKLFEDNIRLLESGALDSDDFRRFRLENGIYGIRNTTDEHMVRIKIKWGNLNADQLDALADIAEKYATPKCSHVTTRQAIQMHHIKRRDVPSLLRDVVQSGLTTREACGNTVRNVTACHFAGVSPEEAFDVRPYAHAITEYFLRNPIGQNLPRKFKFAFEGCPTDHARIPIHDFGAVAKIKEINGKKVRGFQCYVGGGLGATRFFCSAN